MQMQRLGMGNERDRWRDGERGKKREREREGTIIGVMNEGGGRSPQAIAQSPRQDSVALTSLS